MFEIIKQYLVDHQQLTKEEADKCTYAFADQLEYYNNEEDTLFSVKLSNEEEEINQNGTRVRTVKDAGSKDWTNQDRPDVVWGVLGTIVKHSDSHGLVYYVEHDLLDTRAWYEPKEIEVISSFKDNHFEIKARKAVENNVLYICSKQLWWKVYYG